MNSPEFNMDLWLMARSAPHAEPLTNTVEEFGNINSRRIAPDWTGRQGLAIPARGIETVTLFLRVPLIDERRGLMLDMYPKNVDWVVEILEFSSSKGQDPEQYIFRIDRGFTNPARYFQTLEDITLPGNGLNRYSREHLWACDFFQRYHQLDSEHFQRIFEASLPEHIRPKVKREATLDPAQQRSVESLLREVFPNGIDL